MAYTDLNTTESEQLQWWAGLSEDWQEIFLEKLEIELDEFNQDQKGYLAQLFQLKQFDLECRLFSDDGDLSPLSNLTQLTYLDLSYNGISDLSPLANLTELKELSLNNNEISDISPLSNLAQLTELSLWGNEISDLSPLSHLTQLTYLDLSDNKISEQDINWLADKLPDCCDIYLYNPDEF